MAIQGPRRPLESEAPVGEARRRTTSKGKQRKKKARGQTPLLLASGAIVAIVAGALVAPNIFGSEPSGYTDVDPARLATMLEDEDVTLVNVHVPYEGEIPDTDSFIPYDNIAAHTDQLPEDKDAPIVLYCRTGRMSVEASDSLVELGYTNVFNLEGGFLGWEAEGHELL